MFSEEDKNNKKNRSLGLNQHIGRDELLLGAMKVVDISMYYI